MTLFDYSKPVSRPERSERTSGIPSRSSSLVVESPMVLVSDVLNSNTDPPTG